MHGRWLSALVLSVLTGCLSWAAVAQDELHPDDPWQGLNEVVFDFNHGVDSYLLKPVATGYKFVTPDLVETGVSNVFLNLLDIRNILNDVLQWKWGQAGNDTGRFLLNSTVGIAGIFDVASSVGLERSDGEDFGQTLAVWGVDQGPYLVLPLLGPSTLRDGVALPVDFKASPLGYVDHVPTRNSSAALGLVSTRAELLKAEELISGDRYTFMRDAYLQRRNYLVTDGDVEDDFGGDDFTDEDYGY